jgi:class 3 adenylate cyclase
MLRGAADAESVKRYAEEIHRTAGVPLHIRVGVNSGEVVVRSIGSDLHMDYIAWPGNVRPGSVR